MKLECHTARLIRGSVRWLASRKIRGPSASLGMTQEKKRQEKVEASRACGAPRGARVAG